MTGRDHLPNDLEWLRSDEGKAKLARLLEKVAETDEGKDEIRRINLLPTGTLE